MPKKHLICVWLVLKQMKKYFGENQTKRWRWFVAFSKIGALIHWLDFFLILENTDFFRSIEILEIDRIFIDSWLKLTMNLKKKKLIKNVEYKFPKSIFSLYVFLRKESKIPLFMWLNQVWFFLLIYKKLKPRHIEKIAVCIKRRSYYYTCIGREWINEERFTH